MNQNLDNGLKFSHVIYDEELPEDNMSSLKITRVKNGYIIAEEPQYGEKAPSDKIRVASSAEDLANMIEEMADAIEAREAEEQAKIEQAYAREEQMRELEQQRRALCDRP